MRALLLVAHGSRRSASNNEVRELAEQLRAQAGPEFGHVSCAFLELADPLIPAGLEACQLAGAKEVVVLPYFLSAGRHVAEDIPNIVEKFTALHPELEVRLAPYLGTASQLTDTLLQLAKK
jgi:sirohydrochlorin ferrochelatase